MRFLHLLPIVASLAGQSRACSFDSREASIDSVHSALYTGMSTCREIVSSFIARIEAYNPTINAIISLNPKALQYADEMDLALAAGNATGSLFCIPVLLKDNYDTVDMNTTGGCLDLAGSQPTVDAPAVVALQNAGAIILGKTNLHELALEGLSVSSLGGQTINPYDHTRTPGGSSGGTGAAIGASFAVFGTGTDTVNSLRSPASANSLVSVRPTRGLISRAGIIPISYTQDVIGPIARTVKDVAAALTVMASIGYDAADNTTALMPPSSVGLDYSTFLHGTTLAGMRFGLLETFFNRTSGAETTPVNDAMSAMVTRLTAAGATVVPINDPIFNTTAFSANLDVQQYEYREEMDAYLAMSDLGGTHPANLSDLYASGKYLVIPSQYGYVNTALVSSTGNKTYADRRLGIENLVTALKTTFASNELDAIICKFFFGFQLVYSHFMGRHCISGRIQRHARMLYYPSSIPLSHFSPLIAAPPCAHFATYNLYPIPPATNSTHTDPEQKNLVVPLGSPSQSGRNGILAALTSSPVLTVPAGFSPPTTSAPIGVPIGMEILGLPWSEGKLIGIAARIEELGKVRRMPVFAEASVEAPVSGYGDVVPVVTPLAGNVLPVYPEGTL